jgi:PAS domain S-box-containing protein
MDIPLRLLIIEDSESDVALEVRQLKAAGYRVTHEVADNAAKMKAALIKQVFDIVISDHALPQFDAPGALAVLKQSGLDIPFIIVSGAIGEETAVALMKAGAHDYVMKDNLSRLVPAVVRELRDAEVRKERKKAEDMLRQQTDAMNSAIDGMAILNAKGEYIYLNKAHARIYGYENEGELIGKSWRVLYDSDVIQRFEQEFMPELSRKGYWSGESISKKKNGSKFPQAVSLTAMANGGLICVVRDITERKKAEEELRESENKYRLLADNIHDVIFVMDMNLNYTYLSPSVKLLRGYKPEEAMKQTPAQTVTPSSLKSALNILSEIMELEKSEHRDINVSRTFQVEMSRKDGTTVWTEVRASLIRDENQRAIGIMGVTRDITDRKQAEDLLRKNEEKYRTILEDIQEGYFEVDFAGNFTFFNDSLYRFLGYPKEELMGMNNRQYTDKENARKLFQTFKKVYSTGESTEGFDWQIIRKDGTKRYVEASVSLRKDSSGIPIGFRGIARDVTEQKKAEENLKASERKYRLLADNIQDVIFVLDMNLKYTYISPSVKTMRGYEPEEVLKQQPIEKTLTPSSLDLAMQTYSEMMELEKSELREEIPLSRTIQLEMRRKDGTTLWTDVRFSIIRDENNQAIAIMGVTRDITERKKSEEELQKTLDRLKNAVGTTIQVLISAVESRDPYTAGHQKRVADLARTIATEMGLPQDKIEGIRMAGSIHDIGKLSIPAEILSKPTKLTDNEFSLIKEHPRIGYEMLKDVESPWPLAQIVYQHHERMNGTGYPGNLKGDEIIIEARILAVADVVEAMGSHRPYRASLGIEVALEEIEKNKGILYDVVVADACLKIFREKGYQLK